MDMSKRTALIALFTLPLGSFTALRAQGAILTIDLNQWKAIRVQHGKETILLPMVDVFNTLKGTDA